MMMDLPSRCHESGIMHSTKLIKAHAEKSQFGTLGTISTQLQMKKIGRKG